ncbi:MAG: hypothetical protein Q6366_005160 [Candidatus Freyarchaeota archaeon]
MKKVPVLAVMGLLLGIASPLPIWPGPLLLRHIPPGIISFVLILAAYFAGRKTGSKVAGIITIIYGILATLAGMLFLTLVLLATSREFLTVSSILILGSIVALLSGITAIILGWKLATKTKKIN